MQWIGLPQKRWIVRQLDDGRIANAPASGPIHGGCAPKKNEAETKVADDRKRFHDLPLAGSHVSAGQILSEKRVRQRNFDNREGIAYIAAAFFISGTETLQVSTSDCRSARIASRRPARLALPCALALALSVPLAQAVETEAVQEHAPTLQSRILSRVSSFTDRATNLAIEAMSLIGIHYKRGGTSPQNGLDCSGLVRYVFREAHGTELPRTSAEMSKLGEQVDKSQLQPGDLVFFNTLKRTFSHVGIYLGDNKFIHAPSSGGTVRIESMDLAYWKARFNGARRIPEGQQPEPAR